jgi:superfamily I DNA/RNA helicase
MNGTAYRVAIAQTFQEGLKRRGAHAHAIMEAVRRLQEGHVGVHLHALEGLPWVSFNVNRDALRIIAAREGDTVLLVWVDTHDEAYHWAKRHRQIQVGHHLELVRVAVKDDDASPSGARTDGAGGGGGDDAQGLVAVCPLEGIRDRVFRRFGVEPEAASVLRELSEDALVALLPLVQPPLGEALLGLVTDPEDLEAHVARFTDANDAAKRAGPTTSMGLREAVSSPSNAGRVWLLPDDIQAVERALCSGEAWTLFLHPSQRRIVEMDSAGPVLVTGGPGTGKTVVALHRAVALLRHTATSDRRPLLVTTFSRVLARQLETSLHRLCADEPALIDRVVVTTLTQAAKTVCAQAHWPHALLLGDVLDAAWREALVHDVDGRGRRFYELERREVLLPQGVRTEAAYARAKRVGRGGRLDRTERAACWRVLQAFEAALRARGGNDSDGLTAAAIEALHTGAIASPFCGVVCDEVQDAGLLELRLLALLGARSLFLVGDGHQRLYTKPVSLRAAGIEVRGRSRRLRLNYRTTQGICRAAVAVMKGVELDALEREAAAPSTQPGVGDTPPAAIDVDEGGYRSVRAGPLPERFVCADADAEADIVARAITTDSPLTTTTTGPATLVLARTNAALEALSVRLRTRGISAVILGDGADAPPAGATVVLATLHRAKGLEAPTVILTAMQLVPHPFRGARDDEDERRLHERHERSLVYVGMTRARDRCLITRVEPTTTSRR